jgi:hypothetical protein
LLMPLHAKATASDVSCNPGSRKNGVSHGKMLALEIDATILFFLRIRNGSARLCIKLAENAIERLQHYTSISAYNTFHRHRRQEHLTQPLAKKGQKSGTKLLDRVTTNAHTSMAGAEDAQTNRTTTHAPRKAARSEQMAGTRRTRKQPTVGCERWHT